MTTSRPSVTSKFALGHDVTSADLLSVSFFISIRHSDNLKAVLDLKYSTQMESFVDRFSLAYREEVTLHAARFQPNIVWRLRHLTEAKVHNTVPGICAKTNMENVSLYPRCATPFFLRMTTYHIVSYAGLNSTHTGQLMERTSHILDSDVLYEHTALT
jgi:hypothetical protein